eukprot:4616459-Karenia_brevis.AAC.1
MLPAKGLGDLYVIEHAVICPQVFGWPIRRKRFWGVLFHRVLIQRVWGSLDNVINLFARSRSPCCTWKNFVVAESKFPERIDYEFKLHMARPKTLAASLDTSLVATYVVPSYAPVQSIDPHS